MVKFFNLFSILSLFFISSIFTQQNAPFFYFENIYFDPVNEELISFSKNETTSAPLWDPALPLTNGNPDSDQQTWEGTTLFLIDDPKTFLTHYFHFLEHLIGIWEFGGYEYRHEVKHIVFCAKQERDVDFSWVGVNHIIQKLIQALFPNATIHTLKGIKNNHTSPIFIPRTILSSRFCSDEACVQINKMLGSTWQKIELEKMRQLRSIVLSHFNIPVIQGAKTTQITYLTRPEPRRLPPSLESQFIKRIENVTKLKVKVIDLATISYEEQLKIIANTDILISVHGNGLSHILFLPQTATVLEIFPPGFFTWDYQLLAKIQHLRYFGNSGDQWFYTETFPDFPPYGSHMAPVSDLDFRRPISIIKQLAKMYPQ